MEVTCVPPRCAAIALMVCAGLYAGILSEFAGFLSEPLLAQEAATDPVATREYAVALGFQRKKLYEQAAIRWTQFIAKHAADKRLANAHFHLGVCQLRSGKVEAAATFRKILAQYADFQQRDAVQFNLGLALYTTAVNSKQPGDFATAAAEFAKVAAQFSNSPHVPSALYYQAECVFQNGDAAAAVNIYRSLTEKHAGSSLAPTAFFAMATTLQDSGKPSEAVSAYRTFIQKFGSDTRVPECRLRLGLALTDLEKHAEAEKEFTTASGIKDFALADLAQFHQARSKYLQNQLPQAAALFESLPKRFAESVYIPLANLEGGKCRFQAGQLPQARTLLTAVVDAKGEHSAEAAWWLGQTLIQMKQAPAAITVLDSAVRDWPQSDFLPDLTFTRIAAVYEDEKRRPETVGLYAQFAEKFATDELAADARYRAALTALQLSDWAQAALHADRFLGTATLAEHPLVPDALFVSAESRIVSDSPDFPKAEAAYRRIITEFPDHAQFARSAVRIGFCLHAREKHDEAITHLTAILPNVSPPDLKAEAQLLIGLSHAESKRPAEAVKALQASRQAKADWNRGDEVLLALAKALNAVEQPDAAVAELTRLIQQYPKSHMGDRAHFRLGEIHATQKRFDPAIAAFQQVVTKYAESEFAPSAVYGAATAQFDKGDHNAAVNQLNLLLTKYATADVAASGYYLRGLSFHRLKKYAEAIRDLTEYLKRSPAEDQSRPDAQYSLALCHAGLNQHDKTIAVASALLNAKPDYASADKVLYELAFAFAATDKPKDAAERFRELGTRFPASDLAAESWIRVSDYHTSQKQFPESAAACDKGLATVKDAKLRERLLFRKGSSQFAAGQFEQSSATLQTQITEFAGGELLADAMWLKAESCFRLKQLQQSLPWYQKIIDAKNEKYHARALYRSGTCANELAQWAAAQQHFDGLVKQFPEFDQIHEALYGLGFALQNQKQLDQASAVYEQVTERTNTESAAKARFMMGECAFAQKKYDVAWQHFLESALGYPYPEWQALGHFEAGRCFIELQMPDKARESLQTVVDKFPEHERAKDAAKLLENLKG